MRGFHQVRTLIRQIYSEKWSRLPKSGKTTAAPKAKTAPSRGEEEDTRKIVLGGHGGDRRSDKVADQGSNNSGVTTLNRKGKDYTLDRDRPLISNPQRIADLLPSWKRFGSSAKPAPHQQPRRRKKPKAKSAPGLMAINPAMCRI